MLVKAVERDGDADGYETVGDIECRPVIVAPVDIEEIDNFTVEDPVDEIADGAAKDKGERDDQSPFTIRQPAE